jgi:hypothetical protein
MLLFRPFLLLSAIAVLAPHPVFAYIDPGTVSMVIQGFFALIFGAATAWVMRPWQLFKSLFRKRKTEPSSSKPDAAAPSGASDSATKR